MMPYWLPLIEPSRMTIASLLRSRGYGTAYIGKWHLGLEWTTKDGSKAENYYGQDKAFLTCPPLKTVQV
jgi:arylsulfatase A-like enzyme